jgi:hypothetical protein
MFGYCFFAACAASMDKVWSRQPGGVTPAALADRICVSAAPDTFMAQPPLPFGPYEVHIPQLASPAPVTPLARLEIEPGDFPFLAQIRGHEDARLPEYAQAVQTGGPWPDSPGADTWRVPSLSPSSPKSTPLLKERGSLRGENQQLKVATKDISQHSWGITL